MTAQHTPGPWQVKRVGDETSISDADGFLGHAAVYGDSDEQREANARLIAAAPRMYDYISARADTGDAEAVAILEAIHGNA